jgi:hypothetical protein
VPLFLENAAAFIDTMHPVLVAKYICSLLMITFITNIASRYDCNVEFGTEIAYGTSISIIGFVISMGFINSTSISQSLF